MPNTKIILLASSGLTPSCDKQETYSCFINAGRQLKSVLMPSSHFPRTPCDKFVYDFRCDFFFGHRRWLRATAYAFTLSTGIVQFHLWGLGGQPGVNPYRDCAEIVRISCNVSAVAVQSPQPPHRNCAGIGLCTVPVRGLCNATYDMSTVLQFFHICKTSR